MAPLRSSICDTGISMSCSCILWLFCCCSVLVFLVFASKFSYSKYLSTRVPPWVLKIREANKYSWTYICTYSWAVLGRPCLQFGVFSCSAHLAQIQIHKIRRYMQRYVSGWLCSGPGPKPGGHSKWDGYRKRERDRVQREMERGRRAATSAISVISNCGVLADFGDSLSWTFSAFYVGSIANGAVASLLIKKCSPQNKT